MKTNFGPCKLIWHCTNKQMAFEFMADQTVLTHDTEIKRLYLDPFLLQLILGREPKPEELELAVNQTTAMRLKCVFQNPAYGDHIAKRFIKRFAKSAKAQRMLLVPNYGDATKKESIAFWRVYPCSVTPKKILFHVLATDAMGERARRGL